MTRVPHNKARSPALKYKLPQRTFPSLNSTKNWINPPRPTPTLVPNPVSLPHLPQLVIVIPHPRHQINLPRPHKARLKPQFIPHIWHHNDRRREIDLEEVDHQLISRHISISFRRKTHPELRNKNQWVENEAYPRSYDANVWAEG